MSVAIAQAEPKLKAATQPMRRITKEEFLRNYSDMEDGYKYEWNNGVIEKTEAMNQLQATLQRVLLRLFIQTQAFREGGLFTAETDMDTTSSQTRRPDLAIYLGAQVEEMKNGKNQVAPWVGEVISPSDNADHINKKLVEYFKAGVQCVWHIFPASKQVYVYTAADKVKICMGKTVCNGAPALPDFEITAEELFA